MRSADRVLTRYRGLLPTLDAIVLEDYDKGLIDQALVDAIVKEAKTGGKDRVRRSEAV
jgi:bifunctional ADP-heptose synthase (sugar kinase/adenylyltransferase)